MNANKPDQFEALLAEIESIKRLLLYWLMKNGMSQEDVAKALGVNQSTVSRMFSKSTKTPARNKKKSEESSNN
jgi:predicted transcriptional regulator